MEKKLVFCIALLFVGTSAFGTVKGHDDQRSSPFGTLYVGGSGPGNYTTIQDAINHASNGDTIIVYPKTYNVSQIIVNKTLTITGAGWATTIINGGNATLPSHGLVRIIANGNVTFKGFTMRNAGGPPNGGDNGDNLTNVGVYAQSNSLSATYIISDNKILGTNNSNDWEDYGLYAYGGKERLIFTRNVVTHTAANSLLIEKQLGSTEISYNTLDAGCWGIDPIYCMTYAGTNITTLQKISHNSIDVGTGVNPHGPSDNKITAIGFSSAYLGSTGTNDSGRYTNIEISNNTINNLQAFERGIALDNFAWDNGVKGKISGALIADNIINGISTAQTSFGIRLSGLVSGTIIKRNTLTHCDMSFWGRTGYYGGSTVFPTETTIQYNNFEDNGRGLVWEGPALLHAENCWWGNASGPQASGNPQGTGDPISGNVAYTPWLLHPYGPPYANFTYTIQDKTVKFDASASGDYDGIIVSYNWTFGDSTTGHGKIMNHTYGAYNTYTATLTVVDNDGKSDALSKTFTLGDFEPPTVTITTPLPNHLYINLADIIVLKIPFFTTMIIGKIDITVNASDTQTGVQRVEFYVDNELQCNSTTPPFHWIWSWKGHLFPYELKVIAYDNAANQNSTIIKVWKIR